MGLLLMETLVLSFAMMDLCYVEMLQECVELMLEDKIGGLVLKPDVNQVWKKCIISLLLCKIITRTLNMTMNTAAVCTHLAYYWQLACAVGKAINCLTLQCEMNNTLFNNVGISKSIWLSMHTQSKETYTLLLSLLLGCLCTTEHLRLAQVNLLGQG